MEKGGIPVHFVRMRPRIDFDLKYVGGMVKLIRLLKKEKITVVHTHMYKANTPGRIAALLRGVPVIIANEHNIDTWKSKSQHRIDRILAHFTDKIISVSDAVRKFYIEKGIPSEKILTIHNGIKLEKFKITLNMDRKKRELGLKPSSVVIGTVGRLEPQKGHKYFLEAASLIKREIPDAQFLLVGSGSLKGKLREYIRRMGLEDDTILTGFRKDIPEILATMEVFILPSLREGFSISLLEAMASGKPIVATSVGGNQEVICDGECGFLVSSKDSESIARRAIKILKNEELKKRLKRNAQEKVKEFSIEKMASKTIELYSKMLNLHYAT